MSSKNGQNRSISAVAIGVCLAILALASQKSDLGISKLIPVDNSNPDPFLKFSLGAISLAVFVSALVLLRLPHYWFEAIKLVLSSVKRGSGKGRSPVAGSSIRLPTFLLVAGFSLLLCISALIFGLARTWLAAKHLQNRPALTDILRSAEKFQSRLFDSHIGFFPSKVTEKIAQDCESSKLDLEHFLASDHPPLTFTEHEKVALVRASYFLAKQNYAEMNVILDSDFPTVPREDDICSRTALRLRLLFAIANSDRTLLDRLEPLVHDDDVQSRSLLAYALHHLGQSDEAARQYAALVHLYKPNGKFPPTTLSIEHWIDLSDELIGSQIDSGNLAGAKQTVDETRNFLQLPNVIHSGSTLQEDREIAQLLDHEGDNFATYIKEAGMPGLIETFYERAYAKFEGMKLYGPLDREDLLSLGCLANKLTLICAHQHDLAGAEKWHSAAQLTINAHHELSSWTIWNTLVVTPASKLAMKNNVGASKAALPASVTALPQN